jgi:hypothetical protein
VALQWEHVDLDAGVLRVAATIMRINGRLVISEPKTDRSRRGVPLAPAAIDIAGCKKRNGLTLAAGIDETGILWLCETLVPLVEEGVRQPLV